MKKGVFLDRDGTINKGPSPKRVEDFELLPYVKESIERLIKLGYIVFVVSNQPDVARGLTDIKEIDKINKFMIQHLGITGTHICVHDDKDNCKCRKPKPGAILGLAQKYNVDLKKSFMVGDTWKDVTAGKAAGCMTIALHDLDTNADFNADDIKGAVNIIESIDYSNSYLEGISQITRLIDLKPIEKMISILCSIKAYKGRLFFIGVGGGAGNSSHAVNDFRKIVGIDAYSVTDGISEITARINDDGWETCFEHYLRVCNLNDYDGLFVFSVGGGNEDKKISVNIVNAIKFAKKRGAFVLGIVGRDGGFTADMADSCIVVPTVSDKSVTVYTESFQSVLWHLLVSHPKLQKNEMKWESIK